MTQFIDSTKRTIGDIKKTVFVKNLCHGMSSGNAVNQPKNYDFVELLECSKAYTFDIMFAWDKNKRDGALYFGHWNNGC